MIKPWGKSIGLAVFFEILRCDIILVMFETKLYLEAKPSCTKYIVCQKFSKFSSMSVGQVFVLSCLSEQCYVCLRPPDDC